MSRRLSDSWMENLAMADPAGGDFLSYFTAPGISSGQISSPEKAIIRGETKFNVVIESISCSTLTLYNPPNKWGETFLGIETNVLSIKSELGRN